MCISVIVFPSVDSAEITVKLLSWDLIGQQILRISNYYSAIHLTLKDYYLHGHLDECSGLYSWQADLHRLSSSFGIFQR